MVHVTRKKEKYGANIKPKMRLLLTFPQTCQMLRFSDEQVLMPPFYQLINQEERLLVLSKHAGQRMTGIPSA